MVIDKEQFEIMVNSWTWEKIKPLFTQMLSEIRDISDIDKDLSWEWLAIVAAWKIVASKKIEEFINKMDILKKKNRTIQRQNFA